jgi:hypothetical protein
MPKLRIALIGIAILVAASILYIALQDDAASLLPGEPLVDVPGSEEGFLLEQNQPNPFQDVTVIIYHIPVRERVILQVYNTLGAPVVTLVDEVQPPGFHEVEWDGRDRNGNRLPGGVYFYQLRAGERRELRRMVLLPPADGVPV